MCADLAVAPSDVAAFYRARAGAPLWVDANGLKPGARGVPAILSQAADDGLDPHAYMTPAVASAVRGARAGDPASLARAELALSEALAAYAVDEHDGRTGQRFKYEDPALGLQPVTRRSALQQAAAQPTPELAARAMLRMNPIYTALRDRWAAWRAQWTNLPRVRVVHGATAALRRRLGLSPDGGYDQALTARVRAFQADHGLPVTGTADPTTVAALNTDPSVFEHKILANLERLRAIPPDPGPSYIVVDAGGQKLQLWQGGRLTHTMDVAVGKPTEPTPEMAALIRSAIFNPYWNVPPDLAQGLARKVLAHGVSAFTGQHMQALADWSANAPVLDDKAVDWKAVASGSQVLRVRQLPGPDNMMGRVKFMLPNPLGVYLHDTPLKYVFQANQRNVSAGCVRLADALSLAKWLMPNVPPPPPGAQEKQVALPQPTPVFVLYLTVAPTADGLAFRKDVYDRDPSLIAELEGAATAPAVKTA